MWNYKIIIKMPDLVDPIFAISSLSKSAPLDGTEVAAYRTTTPHQILIGGTVLVWPLLPARWPDLILGVASSQFTLLESFAGPAEPFSWWHAE